MMEDKNLNNFVVKSLSISMNNDCFDIDTSDIVISTIKKELVSSIQRDCNKKLFDTKKFSYLDLRNKYGSLLNRSNLYDLVNMIMSSGYTNFITSANIASELQDSEHFKSIEFKGLFDKNSKSLRSTANTYLIGKLNNISVCVDPYMKWDDGRICLFNDVHFNLDKVKAHESIVASFSPRILIEYNIDYNISDSKLIFVIEDVNSETFNQYISLQRDIKIDNILD
jgi:hypothetical protein